MELGSSTSETCQWAKNKSNCVNKLSIMIIMDLMQGFVFS